MITNVALNSILANGRALDGMCGNFVRTKAVDGFSRLYKIVDGKPVFVRAAKTKVKDAGNGEKIIIRKKYTVSNGYQEIEGHFTPTVRTIDTLVKRVYDSNGKRKSALVEEFSYDFWEDRINKQRIEDIPRLFKFPLDICHERGFVGGRWTKLNKDYTGKTKMTNPIEDFDKTRIEGSINAFSMYKSGPYGAPHGLLRETENIYLDTLGHEQNRIHFQKYENQL